MNLAAIFLYLFMPFRPQGPTDAPPFHTPGVAEQVSDIEVLDSFCIEDFSTGPYNVGIGHDGSRFWITEGVSMGGSGINQIYIIDNQTYQLLDQVDQNGTTPGWGLRDLCFDGQYMYGSDDSLVDYYESATREKVGSYVCNACSIHHAQAWDGQYFYTGSFSETIYRVEWDGVSGSTASHSVFSTAIENQATYGIAYDDFYNCLWVTTANSDGLLYNLDMEGDLIEIYNLSPEAPTSGGCCTAPFDGAERLWTVAQDDPDMVYCWWSEVPGLHRATWGGIKALCGSPRLSGSVR